jgi:hypothetical protein
LDASEDGNRSEKLVEEIVMSGTRIKRRDFSSISHLTTIDPTDIEYPGRPTLEEMLIRMPQVVPDFDRASNNHGDSTARMNLRGFFAHDAIAYDSSKDFKALLSPPILLIFI